VTSAEALDRAAPGALTVPFWSAAAEGRLVRPVCDNCGRSFFTPRWACPHCHATTWDYRESSGLGSVYSHTVVFRGPDDSWDVPYVLAIVALDEGWSMLSRLIVEDPAALAASTVAGMRVSVMFQDEERPPFRSMPVFGPVGVDA
jgi:uncharacterized OB-fold protein